MLGFFFLAVAVQGSQGSVLTYPHNFGHLVEVPLHSVAAGGTSELTAGRFLGEGRRHLVLLAGGQAVLQFGPDSFSASRVLTELQPDISSVGVAETVTQDMLLTTGSHGLEAHWYDANSELFSSQLLATGAWIGARHMVAVDLNADGLVDVAALDATGTSILILESQLGGILVARPTVSLGTSVHTDLLGVNLDPSTPGYELVAVGSSMLASVNLTTLALTTFPIGQTILDVAVIKETNFVSDSLAVLYEESSGPGRRGLLTFGDLRFSAFSLGANWASAIAAGDFDEDGHSDLVIQEGDARRLVRLDYQVQGAGQPWAPFVNSVPMPFDLSHATEPPPRSRPATPGPLFVDDIDLDGDLDVWFHRVGTKHAFLQRGNTTNETAQKPYVGYFSFFEFGSPQGPLVLCVPWLYMPSAPTWATHVELTVWRGDERGTEDHPFASYRISVADIGPPPTGTYIPVVLPELTGTFDAHYNFVVRYVECGGGDLREEVGVDAVFTIEGHVFQRLGNGSSGSSGQTPRPPLPAMQHVPDSISFTETEDCF